MAEQGGACTANPVSCFDPGGVATGSHTFARVGPGDFVLIVDAYNPGDEGGADFVLTGTIPP
jgi:hypothetical protein